MSDWDVDVGDIDDLDRRLHAFIAQMLDLRPFWPMVSRLFIGWMGKQFATSGAFGGSPWEPLSPEYAVWKAAHYPGKGILVAEGDLRQAASRPGRDPTPTTLTLTVDWAKEKQEDVDLKWHQQGNTQGMPARPLLFDVDSSPEAARELQDAADDYVDQAARAAGL